MRKSIFFLSLCLFQQAALCAQEEAPVGSSAIASAQASSGAWKQWVFGGTALIVAAASIVFIAFDNGSEVPSSH